MPNEQAETATVMRDAIATEVRAELGRQRKTQREVGQMLGLPQSSIALRLNGKTPFRAEELVALAEALGVSVDRFIPSQTTPAGVA